MKGLMVLAVTVGLPLSLVGQQRPLVGPVAAALAFERSGDLPRAATMLLEINDQRPTDETVLMALSRVLPPLDRNEELLPPLSRALAVDSLNLGLLALAVRTATLVGETDSARAYVDRWARILEGEEEPYREWAQAALEARDRATVREALETGRRRIAHPAALAPELAQLRQGEGNYSAAAREWVNAAGNIAGFRVSAVLSLSQIPPDSRDTVLETLADIDHIEARRLAGLLMVRWGQPGTGVELLSTAFPDDRSAADLLFRQADDELRTRNDVESLAARGRLLMLVSEGQSGVERVQTRMEAARALADAGQEAAARAVLSQVAEDPAAPRGTATAASGALLGVLLAEGKPAEAESLLVSIQAGLSLDERDAEARRVAMAWARQGEFERADRVMIRDSSVAGFDVRGRIRAMAGELRTASELLKIAGPHDDRRDNVVSRIRLVALLQAVDKDTLQAFGQALMMLERGDTSAAVSGLAQVAPTLEVDGAAATRLLAADLALAQSDTAAALDLYHAADDSAAPGFAPAARFVTARISAARGDTAGAETILEDLIIEFPDSAVVPEARRFRDQLRGSIPAGNR